MIVHSTQQPHPQTVAPVLLRTMQFSDKAIWGVETESEVFSGQKVFGTSGNTAGSVVAFDVITETLEKSTLGSKRPGDHVNLERSLKVNDRLDGHFVQGHVDGRATVDRVQSSPREHVIWLRPDASLGPYIIPKGSVAVDGVSLTIAAVEGVKRMTSSAGEGAGMTIVEVDEYADTKEVLDDIKGIGIRTRPCIIFSIDVKYYLWI